MSNFSASIQALLDTSKIPGQIKNIEKSTIITLKKFALDTKGLPSQIQASLNKHNFTINLTGIKTNNLSSEMQSAGNEAGQTFSQSLINKINSQISNGGIEACIATVTQKFNQLNTVVNNMGNGSKTTELQEKLIALESEFQILTNLQKEFVQGGLTNEQLVSKYEHFNNTLLKIKNGMTVVQTETKQFASALQVVKLESKIEKWLRDNTRASAEATAEMKEYLNTLRMLHSQGSVATEKLAEIENGFQKVDKATESAGLKGKSFITSIKSAFASITRYVGASTLIYSTFSAIKNGVKDIVALDTALVDLRKTTDATESELKDFYYTANDTAKKLGVTTQEVIQAAADWSRLGYSIEDAQTMAEVSSIFASISPGLDIGTATDGLVSAMKAFDIEAEDALDGIASKINAIGNSQAVSNEDIVEFLTRSSSAMHEANNTLEETIALGTAATEITRDAASVGNALKTVSMRIRGYDEETEEFVGGVEKLSGDIADLTKSVQHPLGISLFKDDAKTEFKSTAELLRDISQVYDELSDKQQAQLLEKLAGKQRGQIIAAILNNFEAVENSLETMSKSAGSAMREMETIEESLTFKLNALQQTAVGIFQNLFQTEQMGHFIDFLTGALGVIDSITSSLGTLGTALVGVGITAFIKNLDWLNQSSPHYPEDVSVYYGKGIIIMAIDFNSIRIKVLK